MQLKQHNSNLYVLSAANEGLTIEDNNERHERLKAQVKAQGITFTDCNGRFEGKDEKSLILIGTHKIAAHHNACVFGQQCFLKLTPHRDNMYRAYAIDTATGDEVFSGFFRSVSEEDAKRLDLDYTRDSSGTYFTIWPSDTVNMTDFYGEILEKLTSSRGRI